MGKEVGLVIINSAFCLAQSHAGVDPDTINFDNAVPGIENLYKIMRLMLETKINLRAYIIDISLF